MADEEQQKNLQIIQNFRLMDDDFMNVCFSDNLSLTEFVLRIIMERNDLHVVHVETQKTFINFLGRSVRFDIDAIDDAGVEYDIEFQQSSANADPRRARYHSSVMDCNSLKKSQFFKDLRESYVIFITERDVLGEGEPIYVIERTIVKSGRLFGDGEHIIYVNCAHSDAATELGKLVHDLTCSNPDEMYFKVIADVVRYFKETEEGREEMCKLLDDLINEAVTEAVAETTENNRTAFALNLLRRGTDTFDEIAELTALPLAKVQELAAQVVG